MLFLVTTRCKNTAPYDNHKIELLWKCEIMFPSHSDLPSTIYNFEATLAQYSKKQLLNLP